MANSKVIPVQGTGSAVFSTVLAAGTLDATHVGPAVVIPKSTLTNPFKQRGVVAQIQVGPSACVTGIDTAAPVSVAFAAGVLRLVDLASFDPTKPTFYKTIYEIQVPAFTAGEAPIIFALPVEANAGINFADGLGLVSGAVNGTPDFNGMVSILIV